MFYKFENVAEMYQVMSKELLENGKVVKPRGMLTKELMTPVIHIENPRSRLAYLPDRKFNIAYAYVESLLLTSKVNDVDYYTLFNSNMANYSDDGSTLHGAYGWRISEHIPNIVQKLKHDKDSRQAILTIYNNDNSIVSKDVPCTLSLCFNIRDNKLNMVVMMRSNDIILGTSYDIFTFTILQEIISNELGIEMGWYEHIPVSLHVYEQHFDILKKMNNCTDVEFEYSNNLSEHERIAKLFFEMAKSKSSSDMSKDSSLYSKLLANEFNYKYDRENFEKLNTFSWVDKFTNKYERKN